MEQVVQEKDGAVSQELQDACVARYRERTSGSARAHAKAQRWLPAGVNRNIVYHDPHPLFVRSASGAYLEDVDGNRYLDLINNYTSMVAGHSHEAVIKAVKDQADLGSAWAGASEAEAQLARMIVERLPSAERVRFVASGTEATLMAMRAARAVTGRPLIAKLEGGYHGLHDYAVVSMAPAPDAAGPEATPNPVAPAGVPEAVAESVIVLPVNDRKAIVERLRANAERVAGVILEPVMGVAGVLTPEPGLLQELRTLADELGFLLIFDEVISFRLSYGGAQEMYGVTPDLTTLGKVIGGGFPVGAVAGRADVMEVFNPSGAGPRIVLSGTFHANPVVLAAGAATLHVFGRHAVERLNSYSDQLFTRVEGLLDCAPLPIEFHRVGSLFNFHVTTQPVRTYRDAQRADRVFLKWLHLALLNEGVMLSPRGMGALSTAMTEADGEFFVQALENALRALGKAPSPRAG